MLNFSPTRVLWPIGVLVILSRSVSLSISGVATMTLKLPSSDGSGFLARWSGPTVGPNEGANGLSLRGEGGLEATASLYSRTGLVASVLGVVPSY